ncbi:MAG: hypothetical protein VB096_09625 [Pseudoflavonifractor sp.]|nr:hypothetical protein [Pseudoflavonifractor sp.]
MFYLFRENKPFPPAEVYRLSPGEKDLLWALASYEAETRLRT